MKNEIEYFPVGVIDTTPVRFDVNVGHWVDAYVVETQVYVVFGDVAVIAGYRSP